MEKGTSTTVPSKRRYPTIELKFDPKNRDTLYFHIQLRPATMVCLSMRGQRDKILKMLNTQYTKRVILYSRDLKADSYLYEEVERLEYQAHTLYYCNQHMTTKIPFTEENRLILQQYDQQLEAYYQERACPRCVLF